MYYVVVNGRDVYSHPQLTPLFKWIEDRGLKDYSIQWRDE